MQAADKSPVRAWAELLRISNLPTCLTNVLAGAALVGAPQMWWTWVVLAIAGLYSAGMILNDVMDLAYDREHRPERPLPSGRIGPGTATMVALVLMASAIAILAWLAPAAGVCAVVLGSTILAYDLWHRRTPWAVILMGLCRGLVYWVAATSIVWPVPWATVALVSGAVTLYTVLLTGVARSENDDQPGPARHLAWLMPAVTIGGILVAIPGWTGPGGWALAMLAGWLVRAAWLARKQALKQAVMAQLAGFCLIDAAILVMLEQWWLAGVAVAAFLLTVWGHRRIAGT